MELFGREVESNEATIQVKDATGKWTDWASIKSIYEVLSAQEFAGDPQFRTVMRNKISYSLWDVYYNYQWEEATSLREEPATIPRYPNNIMEPVRRHLGLESLDKSRDEEINRMTHHEVFEHVLLWEGIIGYDYAILNWIREIYGVTLD